MDNNEKHIPPEEAHFFKQVKVPFAESKEEMWNRISEKLEAAPANPGRRRNSRPWLKMSLAAAIALLVLTGLTARFYTHTVECVRGQHLSHILPDGSSVELNAATTLSYQPYWWAFKRSVNLEGEGYFKVQKGSNFTVSSDIGSTQVLGTSFNIYTRNNRYEVFCLTGKVRVCGKNPKDQAILTPNMFAEIGETLSITESRNAVEVLAWKDGNFSFTQKPLPEIFAEIERQYDIEVRTDLKSAALKSHSAFFKQPDNPENALNLICESYGCTLKKLNAKTYTVSLD